MKKNIVIVALAVLCLVSLGYGHYQRLRADKEEANASALQVKPEEAEMRAEMQLKKAQAAVQMFGGMLEKQKAQAEAARTKKKIKQNP